MFGTLLTWLSEKTSPVFVIATANDISHLPPELLRKGRLDEIFFVDLPTTAERHEIFRIHVEKRGRKPANFDLDELGPRQRRLQRRRNRRGRDRRRCSMRSAATPI